MAGTTITIATDYDSVTFTGGDVYLGPTYDKLEGWYETPNVDVGFVKRPGAPGAFAPEQTHPDEAVISIEGDMFAANRAAGIEWRERLAALYNEGRPVLVTVADDLRTTTRSCTVEGVGIPWTIHPEFEYSIDMRAADPRRYGAATTIETTLAAPGTGLALPFSDVTGVGLLLPSDEAPTPDLGLDLGSLGTSGRLTVTNEGRVATVSRFIVDANGGSMPDGFVIVNVPTGQRLTYLGPVEAGTTVTLDSETQTAFINGTAPAGRWLAAPEWWEVPPRSSLEVAFLPRGSVTGSPKLTATTSPAF